MIYQDIYQSPIGNIQMIIENEHLVFLHIEQEKNIKKNETPLSNLIKNALDGYFHHGQKIFDIPMKFKGTPFQMGMYEMLSKVTYGQTKCYQELATMMGNPKATRAVGQALHNNPIMIFMPCHRIVGKNKRLTGFAGGLEVKKYLLDLEAKNML
jgi:methylated-DNA-[protein]-cysteine S-methyltransferase